MHRRGKTRDPIVRRPLAGTCALKGGKGELTTVDRIALAAMFSVTMLVLAMFKLTVESAVPPIPAAASAAMSSYVGLPASKPDRRMAHTAGKE